MDRKFYSQSNFINLEGINILKFLLIIKSILQSKRKGLKVKRILFINYKGPFFWTSFIAKILTFYCHILKVEIGILNYGDDKSSFSLDFTIHRLLSKILGYNLKILFFDINTISLLESENYDFCIVNDDGGISRQLIYDSLVYIQEIIDKSRILIISNSFDFKLKSFKTLVRQESSNFVFSSILLGLYSNTSIGFSNKKYDLLVAGSYIGRDYILLKDILDKIDNLKVCIIVSDKSDLEKIKLTLGNNFNIDYILNDNSYGDFIKYINNSKIYFNCISEGLDSFGSTGILLPSNSDIIILSKFTRFYVNKIKNGVFYNGIEDCIQKIEYILTNYKLNSNNMNNVLFIEAIYDEIFFK